MPALRHARVLVVDDEKHLRGMLRDLLATWGCSADVAATCDEALALLEQGRYDLVLTDLLMPGGSGLDLVTQLRQAQPDVGVIVFTGSGAELDADAHRLRFTTLRKPLELEVLRSAVEEVLRRDSAPPAG
jgi:two-component system, NtrC family, response regulator PilR